MPAPKPTRRWVNECMSPEDASAGVILQAGASYIIKCDGPPFEVWARLLDDYAAVSLAGVDFILTGPYPDQEVVRKGKTDARGDLRERDLPPGEYEVEACGGKAFVATRYQEEVDAPKERRGTGEKTWPDVVALEGAEGPEGGAAPEEPGEPVGGDLDDGAGWWLSEVVDDAEWELEELEELEDETDEDDEDEAEDDVSLDRATRSGGEET